MESTLHSRPGPPAVDICRLVAVGDIMLSGEVARRHPPGLATASGLFGNVLPVLRSGDIVFGNLETPLCDADTERTLFRGRPEMAQILSDAGFTVVSMANNHALDYGQGGLRQCISALRGSGVAVLGAGMDPGECREPWIFDRGGLRVGFLGFARTLQEQGDPAGGGFAEWSETEAVAAVRALRPRVDCLVLSLHIGMMWVDYPKPAFKEIADRLMDAGADVVLMHHAHVLQGFGLREDRLAIYNLGNFIADIDEGETESTPVPDLQRESAVFVIDLDRRGVVAVSAVPLWITEDYTVRLADGARASGIVERLNRISRDIRLDTYHREYARQRAALNTGNLVENLLIKLRKRRWGDLARSLLRIRPEHFGMFGRFGARKLGALLRRSS